MDHRVDMGKILMEVEGSHGVAMVKVPQQVVAGVVVSKLILVAIIRAMAVGQLDRTTLKEAEVLRMVEVEVVLKAMVQVVAIVKVEVMAPASDINSGSIALPR